MNLDGEVSRRPHVAAPCVGPAMFAEVPTPEHITGTLKNTVGHSFMAFDLSPMSIGLNYPISAYIILG